ncbi:hypothetical protein [Bacterioplanoides sp.]|uniref:hypothetical protein n=1 Tax=Bacterioplanoides sp. TaxID=2066072 RepID=UPI003B00C1D6
MHIKAKYIRSLTKIRLLASEYDRIRLVYSVDNRANDALAKIGFSDLGIGEEAIPQVVGRKTRINSEGEILVLKDKPKVNKTRSIYRTWNDWHGNPHSGYQDISYKAYPTIKCPPSLHEFCLINIGDDLCFASKEIVLSNESEKSILEIANIILECFGAFNIIDSTKNQLVTNKMKVLEWELLPVGENPWKRQGLTFSRGSKALNIERAQAVEHRMNTVKKFGPSMIARGRNGFNGYFVYGFESIGIFILESVYTNNATYVFKDDWEMLSKLTKSQLINGEANFERIIHNSSWDMRMKALFHSAKK